MPHRRDPRRQKAAPRPFLLLQLLLVALLALLYTSEARKLRSARLSPSAAAALQIDGMPTKSSSGQDKNDGGENDKAAPPAPTLLFTLQSESAHLQLGELPTSSSAAAAAGDEANANAAADFDRGTLTLSGVAPTAVWFAERPARAAGALPTAALASDALDVDVGDDEEGEEEEAENGEQEGETEEKKKKKKRAWLGVPNVALTGTLERGAGGGGRSSSSSSSWSSSSTTSAEGKEEQGEEETITAVLTVLGRPRYDENSRTLTADVRVVPMKVPSGPSSSSTAAVKTTTTTTTTTSSTLSPPPHSPPEQLQQQKQNQQPRSLSLTRAALLIDQLPMSEGYIGNNYGFANDCLSSMSPSCNAFAGTGFYRPGFVGWLGGQMGPGNVPKYPPARGWQAPASSSGNNNNNNQSPPPPPPSSPSPPPPPPNSGGNSGQVYMMSQPYDPSKG